MTDQPTRVSHDITHQAALKMLAAACDAAVATGRDQCIVVVDTRTAVVASVRMNGGKVPSMRSATAKAMTAAANNAPTGAMPAEFAANLAAATDGIVTNLKGGLPIRFGGVPAGAIGVGSGTPDQDIAVAKAALAAIGADEIEV
ncbi:MAG: heme-binding protein [Alphaproteobacteria bacterium]